MPLPIIPLLMSGFVSKLGSILTLIRKHWKVCLGLFVVGCFVFYIYSLNKNLDTLRAEYHQLEKDYEVVVERCKNNMANLEQSILEQNEAIRALNVEVEEKRQAIDEAVKRNDDLKQKFDKQVVDILQEETPSTCDESIKYLIDGTEDLQWQ